MPHRTPKPGNSFGDHSPELIKEWSSKNDKTPYDYCKASHIKVYWICPKGHPDYLMKISNKVYGRQGCPECGRYSSYIARTTPLFEESLGFLSPKLSSEYSDKNTRNPYEIYPYSTKKYDWICPNGHEDYLQRCDSRYGDGCGCPKCGLVKQNKSRVNSSLEESLGFKRADLIFEWSEENEKSIWEVWPGSHYDARWKCLKCSRRWEAPCYSRYSNATGCPHCFKLGQSHIENEIRKSLVIYGALPTTVKLGKWEVDIYIPEKKIVIEYDGDYFHSNPKRIETDTRKSLNLLSLGYKVIRIRDSSKLSTLQISSPNYYEIDWKYKKTPDKELLDKLRKIL